MSPQELWEKHLCAGCRGGQCIKTEADLRIAVRLNELHYVFLIVLLSVTINEFRAAKKVKSTGGNFLCYLIILVALVDVCIENRRSCMVYRPIGHDPDLIAGVLELVCHRSHRRPVDGCANVSGIRLLSA